MFFVVETAKMLLLVIAVEVRRPFLLPVVPRRSPIFASAFASSRGMFAVRNPAKVVEALVHFVSVNMLDVLFIVRILQELTSNKAMRETLLHPTFV